MIKEGNPAKSSTLLKQTKIKTLWFQAKIRINIL